MRLLAVTVLVAGIVNVGSFGIEVEDCRCACIGNGIIAVAGRCKLRHDCLAVVHIVRHSVGKGFEQGWEALGDEAAQVVHICLEGRVQHNLPQIARPDVPFPVVQFLRLLEQDVQTVNLVEQLRLQVLCIETVIAVLHGPLEPFVAP